MNGTPASILLAGADASASDSTAGMSLFGQLDATAFAIVSVDSGPAAWQALEAAPDRFEVVLLDNGMPGLDAVEVIKRMKRHFMLRGIPVILQTAPAARLDMIEGLRVGAFHCLSRPVDQPLLQSLLLAAVDDHRRVAALYRDGPADVAVDELAFNRLREARFTFRSIQAARDLAVVIASASADPRRVAIGLTELLLNAVEHGNLGIGYAEKGRLREAGRWDQEVAQRLADPAYADRKVQVDYRREEAGLRVRITDQGDGFDYGRYLDIDSARSLDSHGRGIAVSRLVSFDSLSYHGTGNVVEVTVRT